MSAATGLDTAAPQVQRMGAVIVTFNPDAGFLDRLASIASQAGRTVVVDNGSAPAFVNKLQEDAQALARVTIVALGDNLGIAKALNVGLDHLAAQGFVWAYTFDHDSLPMENFFHAMEVAIDSEHNVAIFAPEFVDESSMASLTPTIGRSERAGRDILTTMTSGNLVNLPVWSAAGKFDERFFIDYVDHEYCLRVKAQGHRIVQVSAAVLAHNLGKRSLHGPRFHQVSTTNHSATRRYYITRNRLWVYRRYLFTFPAWVLNDMRSFAKETVKVVLFEEQKLTKVWAMLRGTSAAIRGRWGADGKKGRDE